MAICRTIRTRTGISEFLLQSENGDEYVSAFKYVNDKVEVHSLKKEISPLLLEEKTSVNILTHDSFGQLLIAVTPCTSTSCLDLRLWDITNGFTAKDIHLKVEHKKEGKYRCTYDVEKVMKQDLTCHLVVTHGSLLCLILNGNFCILLNARKNDLGVICFDVRTSFMLNIQSSVITAIFLNDQHKTYLVLAEGCNVNLLHVEEETLTSCNIIPVPMKRSKGTSITKFLKLTCSKCLVVDNVGHLCLLSVPSVVTPLKFPSSVGGHSICSVVGFKCTSEGILAICTNEHTINLFSLADVICSISKETVMYVKPYRILCSQYPINSLTFVQNDQLAMASSVNQSITFWGGMSSNFIG